MQKCHGAQGKCRGAWSITRNQGVPDALNGVGRRNVEIDTCFRCRFTYVGISQKHYFNITLSRHFAKGVGKEEDIFDV